MSSRGGAEPALSAELARDSSRAWERVLRRTLCVAGSALALFIGGLLRVRRGHVEAAMRRAEVPNVRRTARGMYRSLGIGLFELLLFALFGERARLSIALPTDAIERLFRSGQGAVIATAHTGNWDLAACALAGRAPLTVVTKRFSVRLLDRLWQGARSARGVRLVGAGGAARAASQALGRGELVAMMFDQAPERGRGVIRARFLGASAWVDLAPALVALRNRAPLVVAFPRRRPDGGHDVEIARIFEPPRRVSRQVAIDVMVEATALLDDFVRRNPEQWLWMHRRWKD